jgi:prephenate dehydratase
MTPVNKKIVFQGEPGANSHIACREAYPEREAVPCPTFEDALAAIRNGEAELGMIPMENTLAGRVADIHHLLPESGLYIIGEHYLRVYHHLMAPEDVPLENVTQALSHPMALGQCRKTLRGMGISPVIVADTAGAARQVSEEKAEGRAALASELAAEVYGLKILRRNVEDEDHNTTRFLILSRDPARADMGAGEIVTSFVFRVRNVPAALYKALGGFATNGVNMTKLESYQIEGSFSATQFYADIIGHPEERLVRLAFEELDFFTSEVRILGVYTASPLRAAIEEASARRQG